MRAQTSAPGVGSAIRLLQEPSASPSTPSPSAPRPAPPSIEAVRSDAAKASGVLTDRGAWRLKGIARLHGADQAFEMVFDSRLRFRMTTTGPLPQTDAFDGSACWTSGPSGTPHPIILADRDVNRLIAWTLTGSWAMRSAPLLRSFPLFRTNSPASSGEQVVLLKPRDGGVSAILVLDAAAHLPQSLLYWTASGDETWAFANYKQFGERMLPTHIVHRSGGQDDVIEIASADRIEGGAPSYRMPAPVGENAEFDTTANNRIEVKRIGGYLFVRPAVDGREGGWFFLDTGADSLCIDPSFAKTLKLPIVGSATAAGVVAVTHLNFCRATTMKLGPVTLKNPVFLEFDLTPIANAFKLPIIGICGYDFLARVALDIDPKANVIQVFKPGGATPPADARWTTLHFNANTPCLECRFAGGHRGFFSVDTGSGATVDFFTPAVEKLHLLAHQDGTKRRTGGAGGTAESRQGVIDWFELGGTRIEKPTAGFQLTKQGVFASPYLVGNLGMGFLGKFRLLLDYQNERIAFVPE